MDSLERQTGAFERQAGASERQTGASERQNEALGRQTGAFQAGRPCIRRCAVSRQFTSAAMLGLGSRIALLIRRAISANTGGTIC